MILRFSPARSLLLAGVAFFSCQAAFAGTLYVGISEQLTSIQVNLLSGDSLALTGLQDPTTQDSATVPDSFVSTPFERGIFDLPQAFVGQAAAPPENTFSFTALPTGYFARSDELIGSSYVLANGSLGVAPQINLIAEAYNTGNFPVPLTSSIATVGSGAYIATGISFIVNGAPAQVQVSFNYLLNYDSSLSAGSRVASTDVTASMLVDLFDSVSGRSLIFTNPSALEFDQKFSTPGDRPAVTQGTYQSAILLLPPGNYTLSIISSIQAQTSQFVPEPSSAIPAGTAAMIGLGFVWPRRRPVGRGCRVHRPRWNSLARERIERREPDPGVGRHAG